MHKLICESQRSFSMLLFLTMYQLILTHEETFFLFSVDVLMEKVVQTYLKFPSVAFDMLTNQHEMKFDRKDCFYFSL